MLAYDIWKRVADVSVSAVALVLLLPLFALAAALIKIDSRGPAFFVQDRVGRHGRVFGIYKFRTMNAEAGIAKPNFTRSDLSQISFQPKDDPRITRVGRFLRRGFDELPGLANVLRGDMSLVGPRPDVPEVVSLYDSRETRRLSVKPGITSLAIVRGRGDLTIQETIELDLEYVERRSALLDLKIMVQTLWVVLVTGKGAR